MLRLSRRYSTKYWQITGTCPYTRERIRTSTRSDRESEAKDILTAFLARRHREAVHGPESSTLVAEAVFEYVNKGGDARFLGPILDHLGKRRMSDIEDVNLSELARRAYPECKPSTLVRQLYGPMQAVWNAAVRAKMAQPRTFAKPKVKRPPAKYADITYMQALFAAILDTRQTAIIAFMTYSGARTQEVVDVLVRHYNRQAGNVLLENTKNGTSRVVSVPPSVAALLERLDLTNPSARLFGYSQRFAINNILRRASHRAGIPYLSPHKVGRHTFAARLLSQGHSLKLLQEAGGWKSSQVVMSTYAHIEKSVVEQAMRSAVEPEVGALIEGDRYVVLSQPALPHRGPRGKEART